MIAYGGVDVYIHILTSAVVRGEWSASCPCRFTRGERAPGTHWTRGWVDPRDGLDDLEKILDPPGTRTLGSYTWSYYDHAPPRSHHSYVTWNLSHCVATWTGPMCTLCSCHRSSVHKRPCVTWVLHQRITHTKIINISTANFLSTQPIQLW
jgi:hypothetical protein